MINDANNVGEKRASAGATAEPGWKGWNRLEEHQRSNWNDGEGVKGF